MLNLEERTGFMTIFDFHVKKNMPIHHYPIFPEPIIPSFQYSNVPIVSKANRLCNMEERDDPLN